MLSICLTLIFGITLSPYDFAFARGGGGRGGGGGRSGGSPGGGARFSGGGNTRVNLQNQGNVSNFNRPTNSNLQNRNIQNSGNVNRNIQNSGNVNRNIQNSGNVNRNIQNSGNVNRNISGNTVNVNRNINRDQNWYAGGCRSNCWGAGGGWYGRGYYTPPGWGLAAFGTSLAIGAALSTPPPNYSTLVVGGSEYLYSDGIYVQPNGSSYIVTAPPEGAVVSYLPDGCTATNSNGTQLFECSGVIYQPFYQNGDVVYQVVNS
ncbi:hypothetical protein DO97_06200 [Neosynechococcus sphagnicola sy1]|uniref:Uncharacterized protein n=1 Tax=Neosynechococcus sphagnicola sy1 TaxID=1497020 RepID=A0A098TNR0_9CYAN|nr:hypothetical protein DO97_06200 [Neosynechococcus sphagnicola sy1]